MNPQDGTALPHLLLSLQRRPGALDSVLIHPAGGGLIQYLTLAGRLARHGAVYGIRGSGLLPDEQPQDSVVEMTGRYLAELATLPRPPRLLVGWSLGGVIAWELAARLAETGPAPAVIVIDGFADPESVSGTVRTDLVHNLERSVEGLPADDAVRARTTALAHLAAAAGHRVEACHAAPALLLVCAGRRRERQIAAWQRLGTEHLTVRELDCGHFEVFQLEQQSELLEHIDEFLAGLDINVLTAPLPVEPVPQESPR